jgi:predicted LPLAT superfamily acyltransferase
MTPQPTASHSAWAHAPERSNLFLLRVMTWISLRLGRRTARGVLHLIAAYFLLFAPASRRASRSYLGRALGRPARWRDLYRHFFTFAATIHDRLYLVNRRFDLFDLEVHGRKETDLRVAMLMHQDNAKKINAMLAAINPQAVQDIIGLGQIDSMLKVRERLDAGGVVGMLADRTPGNEAVVPVQILGSNANLPSGAFRMAALLRRPVVFMTGLYLGGNRYAIHFDTLADFSAVAQGQRAAALQAAITRYAALLDQYCRKAPYNWFNFFDFWQPAATTTPPKS